MTVVNAILWPLTSLWRAASTSASLREMSGAMKGLGFRLVRRTRNKAQLEWASNKPVASVDERYLSYSIDISVLAGGFWWEGSSGMQRGLGTLRVPPLDLNSKQLDRMVKALGPAYLRVGGSEADKIHYFEAPSDEPQSLVLTKEIWDRLHLFIQRNQLGFAFTVKYGLFKRKLHGGWTGGEVEKLFSYSRDQGYTIDICELGNELNAYWAFHGLRSQPRAKNLAIDYKTFVQLCRNYFPESRVIGPGSAFWPLLGETIRPFSNITRRFLEVCRQENTDLSIVDWHYYPFQSERSPVRTRKATLKGLVKPKALNDFKKYAQRMRQYRDTYYPNAMLWTGETGSAQCGGQARLSDRFASCFWWADQLGLGALNGQNVMIRQSLIGGEYGLIDRLTLKPRPDYWMSWLWKKLMGTEVYVVNAQHHLLRSYCHNTPGASPGSITLMLINLSAKPITIEAPLPGSLTRQYIVSANKLNSKKIFINGFKPRFKKGKISLKDFDQQVINSIVPGYSINFWLYESSSNLIPHLDG